jgi:ABC-type Fe3+-hydroxamate transport system substrate-binding protein
METIFEDQLGREVRLPLPPQRIVSIVPSQTELLYDLGLESEVIGITKFCVHPERWYKQKQRVGGTKQLNIELIRELNPDLIIGNKEENSLNDILALEKVAPIWMSDITTIDEALEMISTIGSIVGRKERSLELIDQIRSGFTGLSELHVQRTFLYFIWKDPDYVAGTGTFIHSVLESAGFVNHCREERYPEWNTSFGEPDVVFLSTEPYPFKEEHLALFQERFQGSEIMLVDGEMCSWYGSRMLQSVSYLSRLQGSLIR